MRSPKLLFAVSVLIAVALLLEHPSAQQKKQKGVVTFDAGEVIEVDRNSDRMKAMRTQLRLADTRIMDFMRDSMMAVQQGHRTGFQHFAVWFRKYHAAQQQSSGEIAKMIAKAVLTKGLAFLFPEATPFIEVMKAIADLSIDIADKMFLQPTQMDPNVFLERLRTAEEEYIKKLLDTPQRFRQDHASELEAAKWEYMEVWMEDETRGPQGQDLPASVRSILDGLGVPAPGANTATRVAEGILATHINTILLNDQSFQQGFSGSTWEYARAEALIQMDRAGNLARICEIQRRCCHDFLWKVPARECRATPR